MQLKIFIYYYNTTNISHGNFFWNQENIQRFIIIFLFLKEKFNFKYYSNIN